jgi:hypothetical protein
MVSGVKTLIGMARGAGRGALNCGALGSWCVILNCWARGVWRGELTGARYFIILLVLFGKPIQAQDLEKKISLRVVNEPLGTVLEKIGKEGDILFSYNPSRIPLAQKVTLKVARQPVRAILDELLVPLNITWTVSGHQVILRAAEEDTKSQKTDPALRYTISGFLRDSVNGEVLIGAAVYDPVSMKGTLTNAYGFFSLSLPGGNYRIVSSMVGYAPEAMEINLSGDRTMNINLKESSILIPEVEILSEHETPVIDPEGGSQVRFSSTTLRRMAGFAGNVDVVKSIQSIPGIHGFGDGSSFYYVRGGDKDQNLLLIDEAPIFNPAHLFGFFSALAPDAIKDIKAYKGDLPASYGGRLSSVIDVHARDGNLKRHGFSGNIGIFTSDLTVEGPLAKEKSSYILSIRKSNLDWLTNRLTNQGQALEIDFFDVNAKLNIKINNKNRIFLTGFSGKDNLSRLTDASIHTYGLSWDNATGTLRWNHIFNNRLFLNTTVLFSKYNYYLYISREQDTYWTSSIRTGTLKSDLSWFVSPTNTYRAGIELSNYRSNPGNVYFPESQTGRVVPEVSAYQSAAANLYISNERTLFESLSINAGIRLAAWRNLGPATVYIFDANYAVVDTITVASGSYYAPYYTPEPRVSLQYKVSSRSSVTAGYTRTSQYLQMLSNSTSPFTSLEVWAPAGPVIKPQKADQFTIGYLTSRHRLNFSAEAFYKKMYNQVDYKDHANMLYNPLIEGELRFGNARAYGVELLIRKSEGRLSGWVGYSWSRAFRTIDDVNGGKEFPASFDHPHSIFTNIVYTAGKRLDISAGWVYMTGSPFTSPTGFMQYNGYVVPVYGEKNNDRFPDYHRLDLSFSFRLNKPESRYRHNLVLSFYNAYGRSNPFSVSFNKIMDDKGNFVVPADLSGDLEIIPTRISVAGVIPSLNYTFKF